MGYSLLLVAIIGTHSALVVLARRYSWSSSFIHLGLLSLMTSIVWFGSGLLLLFTRKFCSQCTMAKAEEDLYYGSLGLHTGLCRVWSGLMDVLPYVGIPKCYLYPVLLVAGFLFIVSLGIAVLVKPIQKGG